MAGNSPRKVKVGVVGCGVVATAYYLPYLMKMDTVELVAVCDRFETRARASARLFGAKEQYLDYDGMIARADIEAVLILTAPGTHAPFTLKAVEAGKHVLLQKPMATNMEDARAIASAVRKAHVKALIEPSANSPLDPDIAQLRRLVKAGVLGDILWFSLAYTGPTSYGPGLGSNPYGQDAFYTKDSGGFLFDFPYAPTQIVGVLGACKSVMAQARISVTDHYIVPEIKYDEFLEGVTDPEQANYWDVVLDLPRTQHVRMEAYDNVFSLYEMVDGSIGACHAGRIFHPVLPGTGSGGLQIFGAEGNLLFGAGYTASIISTKRHLLPQVDTDGWFHIPLRGDVSKAKWPQPVPGGFNYYHASTQEFIDSILEDRDPFPNVEWGLPSREGSFDRTGVRTPMQWDSSPNAGFSSASPEQLYLPIDSEDDRPTVQAQDREPTSLLNQVRKLIHLRRSRVALQADAEWRVIYAERGHMPIVYERHKNGERLIIAINPTLQTVTASLSLPGVSGPPQALWCQEGAFYPAGRSWRIKLSPASGGIYQVD